MSTLAVLAVAGCLAVSPGSDHILLTDLTAAFSGNALAADTPIGLAPAPGVRRLFTLSELGRIALRFHLSAPEQEVCVERSVSPPDPARLLAAMRLEMPNAVIEILDYSRAGMPGGEIVFPTSSLRADRFATFWGGYVRYAGNRRFTLWAKVKVSIAAVRVIAAETLRAGQPIAPSQLRLETRDELPGPPVFVQSIDEAVGKAPRLAIAPGTAIRVNQIQTRPEVVRGDTVHVDVRNGGAHLGMSGQAESSGRWGDVIPVLNLESRKRFPARVIGKGVVSVGDAPAKEKL